MGLEDMGEGEVGDMGDAVEAVEEFQSVPGFDHLQSERLGRSSYSWHHLLQWR